MPEDFIGLRPGPDPREDLDDERDESEKLLTGLHAELRALQSRCDSLRLLLAQTHAEKEQALLRAERAERDLETLQSNLKKLVTK